MLVWHARRDDAGCTVSAQQQIPPIGPAPGLGAVILAPSDPELAARGMYRSQVELSDCRALIVDKPAPSQIQAAVDSTVIPDDETPSSPGEGVLINVGRRDA